MKIAFCGTQSTGKSTLVKELAKLKWFENYKIFTERSAYLASLGIPLNEKSTFKGQLIFTAERASELMCPNFLSDRSSLDVVAFTLASEEISMEETFYIHNVHQRLLLEYDYIFYIPPEIPLEDNGIRNIKEEFRAKIDSIIKDSLYVFPHFDVEHKGGIITGTLPERINKVCEILKITL